MRANACIDPSLLSPEYDEQPRKKQTRNLKIYTYIVRSTTTFVTLVIILRA